MGLFQKRHLSELVSAENGKLAVEAVERMPNGFDIIFMDMSMPVMNGFEFLDRYAEAYAREAAHFADMIEGAAPAITVADGVRALALAEAAARSAKSGRFEAV